MTSGSTPEDQDSPPALAARQERLERAIRELRVAVAEAREAQEAAIERLDGRVAQLQSRTAHLQHVVQGILNSRIWRALVAAGGVLLASKAGIDRVLGRATAPEPRPESGQPVFRLLCDEPPAAGTGVSGTIVVRGWAVASSGVSRIEVQAGDAPVIEARYGLYRPDIEKQFPGIENSDRSGYQTTLDTSVLPNGLQSIAIRAFSENGARAEIRVPIRVDHIHGFANDYYRWIAEFEKRDPELIEMKIGLFARQPLVSVLVPVYRTAPAVLEQTIASVRKQSYPNWELCIADDCSRSPEIDALLERHAADDARIKVTRLEKNGGISSASNAALALAAGEFVALLDHDDELAPDALYHAIDAHNRDPEAGLFYSDEDHIDENGVRSDPFFKPAWSPDLILSENYVCHLMVFRRDLCLQAGGFRGGYDLSQDHDLLLRMSRQAKKIVHIPKILYHWRTEVHTIDRASGQLQRALDSSRRAVEDHVRTLHPGATVEPGVMPSRWRVRYPIPQGQRVRIIMPCGGKVDILERCLASLAEKTDYPDYEIVVVDNSRGVKVEQFVKQRKIEYVDYRHRPFNFSAMNNLAAEDATAPLLLFLNDDVSAISPDWLTAMVELASRPEVGAVGAKLLYPDDTIQHAGVVLGPLGLCAHGFKGALDTDRVYFDFPHLIRNVSAVTGACMMVPARLFRECGGFDTEALPVAYQDIDLCLKLREKGYRILYTPHARLYHFEAISKRAEDKDPRPAETQAFKARWKEAIENDPFYSPNLTRTSENYSYRKKALARAETRR